MRLKDFLFLLFAHHTRDDLSHTIKISIGKREFYLCARCTGIYSALVISALLFAFVINVYVLPVWINLILAFTFGTPVLLSWSKQTITGRENSNKTRILTGIGGGIGLAILFYTPTPFREFSIMGIFAIIFLILYFGKIRRYKKEDPNFQRDFSA